MVDLFAGAGGFSEGFRGFNVTLAKADKLTPEEREILKK